ncbi:MAG: aliphatic sulfonates import ATP-binding protein SsuB [Chloroflexota bacterium]|jgi:ABC-type nitrate/sulfonate/bicarbonate transport system ATPase subunit
MAPDPIVCTDVGVTYPNGVHALTDVSLRVAQGSALALVGPSGCGKTTLLRAIAGLERVSTGSVTVAPGARLAMVFQSGLLFPWLSVADNIGYGLMTQGVAPAERRVRAHEWAERMGLQRFFDAYPHQLSGGMQQRVGIARALATRPDIVLFDEPFAALDAQTRLLMQELVCDLRRQGACGTMVFVTHAIDEALIVAERIVVLSARPGRVIADVTPGLPDVAIDTKRTLPAFQQAFGDIWGQIRQQVAVQMQEGVL